MKRTKAAGFLLALLMTAGQVTAALASEPELALPAGVPGQSGKQRNCADTGRSGRCGSFSDGNPDISAFSRSHGGIYGADYI